MNTTVTVDHTAAVAQNSESYLPCSECTQVWRLFPRALPGPYALPVDPATGRRAHYRVTGAPVPLYTTLDDGQVLEVSTSWHCTCGALQIFDTPTLDRVECSDCAQAAWQRNPPGDYYTNPRYGQRCSCCGVGAGYHSVRRDQLATFQCRSQR